jgi:hypothetical protein
VRHAAKEGAGEGAGAGRTDGASFSPRLTASVALGAAALAVLAAALWLRAPRELYLTLVLVATVAAAAGASRLRDHWARGSAGAFVLAVVAFVVPAGRGHWTARELAAPGATEAARGAAAVQGARERRGSGGGGRPGEGS